MKVAEFKNTETGVLVYRCGVCFNYRDKRQFAEVCCKPNTCECGAACELYRTACRPCLDRKEYEKEVERFKKATRVDPRTYDGPVWDEHASRYHDSLESFYDYYEADGDQPPYVYCCDVETIRINAEEIIERAVDSYGVLDGDDEYVEFEHVDKLTSFIEAWNKLQEYAVWEADHSRVIEFEQDEPDEDAPVAETDKAPVS